MEFQRMIQKLNGSKLYKKRPFGENTESNPLQIYVFKESSIMNKNYGILIYEGDDPAIIKEYFSMGYKSPYMDKPYIGLAIRSNEVVLVDYLGEKRIRKSLSKLSPKFLTRLDKLIDAPDNKDALEELFNRKDLIDEFYQLYRLSRNYILANLQGQFSSEEEKYDYADNLLLTILTLWFLQERNFFNNDPHYFVNLFKKKQEGLFNKRESFYDMLRKMFSEIDGNANTAFVTTEDFGKLVVLGPALFLYKDQDKKSNNLPDSVFYRAGATEEILLKQPKQLGDNVPIFNLMESRDWMEGNIDEYVIGAIYEKLIDKEERKKTGANYTPDNITKYMSKHSIEPWFLDEIRSRTKLDASNVDLAIDSAGKKDIPILFEILQKVKICDPAVGSAHYLESSIDVLVDLYEKLWRRAISLGMQNSLEIKTADEKGKIVSIFLTELSPLKAQDIEKFRLHVKFFIILSRNLYGVDINASALRIARARLFLSLAKHFDLKEQRFIRFPNVHFNLKHGNSLVGYIRLDQKSPKRQAVQLDLFSYTQKESTAIVSFLDSEIAESKKTIQGLQKSLGIEGNLYQEVKDLKKIFAKKKIDRDDYHELILTKSKLTALSIAALSLDEAIHLRNLLDGIERSFRGKLDDLFSEEYNFDRNALGESGSFHWEFEFPEVFSEEQEGYDIIVGNPPYLGGQKLTGALGNEQREYLVNRIAGGKRGSADLVAYFFIRSMDILKQKGELAYLSTNTTSQGDTREVGLDQILESGATITRAMESFVFPGDAAVHVVMVFLYKGTTERKRILVTQDGEEVEVDYISSYLTQGGEGIAKPYRLKGNAGKSFQGSIVLGLGFTLTPEEAEELIQKNPKNKDCIYPYLNGEDLNSSPTQEPSRFVINFFDWPLERKGKAGWFTGAGKEIEKLEIEKAKSQKFTGKPSHGFTFYTDPHGLADTLQKKRKAWLQEGVVPTDYPYPVAADYPDLLEIVREKVKPERTLKNSDGSFKLRYPLYLKWWIYAEKRPKLYGATGKLESIIVKGRVANKHSFDIIEANTIPGEACVIMVMHPDFMFLTLLQSTFHEKWSWENASSLKGDLRYSPSDCFDTFPFPDLSSKPDLEKQLESLGKKYHEHRKAIMLQNEEGLTKTYNRFHNPEEESAGRLSIQSLRDLHTEMDNLVRDAYGWSDLDLEHGFHSTKQGIRFTISEKARKEILGRLLALNHERFAEEKAKGLWDEEIRKGKV